MSAGCGSGASACSKTEACIAHPREPANGLLMLDRRLCVRDAEAGGLHSSRSAVRSPQSGVRCRARARLAALLSDHGDGHERPDADVTQLPDLLHGRSRTDQGREHRPVYVDLHRRATRAATAGTPVPTSVRSLVASGARAKLLARVGYADVPLLKNAPPAYAWPKPWPKLPRYSMVERRAPSSTSWGSLVRAQYRPSPYHRKGPAHERLLRPQRDTTLSA